MNTVGLQAASHETLGSFHVSLLTLFGLFAVTSMMVCYAMEARSSWFILGFAGACAMGSVYGFLQGAWPFGVVEGAWTMVAFVRWKRVAALGA